MSDSKTFDQVYRLLATHFDEKVKDSTVTRVALLVVGIIKARSASPARIAEALHQLGLTGAMESSIERTIRRIENDPQVNTTLCLHLFARERLLFGHPEELLLILDPTTQDDRVVMAEIAVWYRGRALPIAWMVWPGNVPLEGDGFWERIGTLLKEVKEILPKGIPVTLLADRAFGTPAFTDMLGQLSWHYVVRIQNTTKCLDRCKQEHQVQNLIHLKGQKAKMRGQAFKKYKWREVSIVVYWGRRHKEPLCLASDLRPRWELIHLYRRRYPIEAGFRDYKSLGWHWEQGQVTDLEHIKRLLVGMALATWIAIFAGTQVAKELLNQPPNGKRRTVPWEGKRSLFMLGLARLHKMLCDPFFRDELPIVLEGWDAPNWHSQLYFHHARAFVFGVPHAA